MPKLPEHVQSPPISPLGKGSARDVPWLVWEPPRRKNHTLYLGVKCASRCVCLDGGQLAPPRVPGSEFNREECPVRKEAWRTHHETHAPHSPRQSGVQRGLMPRWRRRPQGPIAGPIAALPGLLGIL